MLPCVKGSETHVHVVFRIVVEESKTLFWREFLHTVYGTFQAVDGVIGVGEEGGLVREGEAHHGDKRLAVSGGW